MAPPVFVTGATGFVGLNLVRLLRQDGVPVRALARPASPGRKYLEAFGAEAVNGDVTDPESIRRALKGCRRVYHVAGSVEMSEKHRAETTRINVAGTDNVCQAALEEGVERLVHTSSNAAVGTGTFEEPATEEKKWDFGPLKSPYHDTKHQGEQVALGYVPKGLPVVSVNPCFMIGAWDIKPTSGTLLLMAARHGIPIYTPGSNNYLDVEDAARGHILAMERGRPGQRYILGNENLSYREFFTRLNRIVGRGPPRIRVAYPMAWLMGLLGEATGLGGGDLNRTTARMSFSPHCASPEKARRELGLPASPVDEAIRRALKWFREHGYTR